MKREFDRKLVLEDGTEYFGYAFGDKTAERVTEIVFNTSMVGYQEIISDPSCLNQTVVMTYPLIGNYGTADEDFESRNPNIGGLVVREYNNTPSNFRYTKTLSEILEEHHIPGISGIDTRKLTRFIRDNGSCRSIITSVETPTEKAVHMMKTAPVRHDEVSQVSCKKRWYSRTYRHKYSVVVVDFGVPLSMIRNLTARGCNITVVPWDTSAEEIIAMAPDGILLSDGPGDPTDIPGAAELVKKLTGSAPIVGVGLGCQLISLAYGAKTYKMSCGHRGPNHPVRNLSNDRIEIVSQNHGYSIEADSVYGTGLEVTHVDVLDNTVEAVESKADGVFGVLFYPESSSATEECPCAFDKFVSMMEDKINA